MWEIWFGNCFGIVSWPCLPKKTNHETLFHVFQRIANQETLFPSHVSQRKASQETLFPSHVSQRKASQETPCRKHCFIVMCLGGGQTRKHCSLVVFLEGGQTRNSVSATMFAKLFRVSMSSRKTCAPHYKVTFLVPCYF
jgi:hypothetical protein